MNPAFISSILEAALRAMVLALTVWAGLRVMRVKNVRSQKAAWGLVLALSLLMPLMMRCHWLSPAIAIKVPFPAWMQSSESRPATAPNAISAPISAVSTQRPPEHFASSEPFPATGDRFPAPTVSSMRFDSPSSAQSKPEPGSQAAPVAGSGLSLRQPLTIAGVFYLIVCAGLLLRMTYGLCLAMKIWASAQPILPEQGLDFAPGLRWRWSELVASPVTIGSGIVLPADYIHWEVEKLRIVLAHEGSHIRQGDFYLQMLAGVYSSLFWFSPFAWWLKRKLSELGEVISDHAGLKEAASCTSYAQILLEFAAMPRPTLVGVAMARTSNLSRRIDQLLNDSSFRQAFAGSRRRALLAVLLVSVALFAATALVRVEAAQAVPPASPQVAAAAVAQLPAEPVLASPAKPGHVDPVLAAPPAQSQDQVPPAAPAAPVAPAGVPPVAPPMNESVIPPLPPIQSGDTVGDAQSETITNSNGEVVTSKHNYKGRGYAYSNSTNGDSWALVTDPSQHVRSSGDWNNGTRDAIEKVRSQGHGKFLFFTHNGKSYFLDDPSVIAQIEAMYKPMEELGRQQEGLGHKQAELGKQQEELGRQQQMARVPTPDMSKEMAELNSAKAAAMAILEAKKAGTISQQELADLQGKMGAIQGRLGDLQGRMGEEEGKFGELQGKLGEQQGKLGAEQGRLGAEQGRIAGKAGQKVKEIIDQSLSDGKAQLVE